MDINKLEALERIADLKRQGVLTEEEFQSAKQRILSDEPYKAQEEADEPPFHGAWMAESQSVDLVSWFKKNRESFQKETLNTKGKELEEQQPQHQQNLSDEVAMGVSNGIWRFIGTVLVGLGIFLWFGNTCGGKEAKRTTEEIMWQLECERENMSELGVLPDVAENMCELHIKTYGYKKTPLQESLDDLSREWDYLVDDISDSWNEWDAYVHCMDNLWDPWVDTYGYCDNY